MANIKYFIIAFVTLAFFVSSCTDTPTDGDDDLQKYVGTWNVSDQSARINYSVTIEPNPSNSAEILLNNFAGLGSSAVALVVGNSLAIDSQSVTSDYTVSGSGSYVNSKKLIINFDLNDGIDSEPRIATFTR